MNYNGKTKILTISPKFDEELRDLPNDVIEIYY